MTKSSTNRLLIKFRDSGAINRLTGSVGARSTRTVFDLVNDLVQSQYAADSQNGPRIIDNQLRCYDISTVSSLNWIAAFYWNAV